MKISFVDAPSFADKLKNLFSRCTGLDVAMAYVKIGGLRAFLNALNESTLLKESMPIRIVVGMSSLQGITDKDSAKLLLRLSQKRKNVAVRKYDNPRFHPKLMIFHGNPSRIVVGSSNLTEGAQSENAEANVIVEDPDGEFMKDAVEFFDMHFDKAPSLEPRHVAAYTPRSRIMSRGDQGSYSEDRLPSSPKQPFPDEQRHGPGKPAKPKSYYDQRIRELENKKELTRQQKLSLGAYRALRTRYYWRASKKVQRLAILMPVTHGESHLGAIVEAKHGNWVTGCKIPEDPSRQGIHIYFYESQIKQARHKGIIQMVQHANGKTRLTISDVKKLRKSRKLGSFKKLNGENVRALRSFAYVSDPEA